jgi:hypothetical protein
MRARLALRTTMLCASTLGCVAIATAQYGQQVCCVGAATAHAAIADMGTHLNFFGGYTYTCAQPKNGNVGCKFEMFMDFQAGVDRPWNSVGPLFQTMWCGSSQLTPPRYPLYAYDVIRLAGDTASLDVYVFTIDCATGLRVTGDSATTDYEIPPN